MSAGEKEVKRVFFKGLALRRVMCARRINRHHEEEEESI